MAQIIFRGVKIADWTGKHDDTGQKFEVYMIADFSDKVREALGWTIAEALEGLFPKLRDKDQNAFDRATMLLPANVKTISLDGDLAAKNLELIPNGSLKDKAIELVCSRVKNFSLHRTKQPNGTFDWELQFTAVIVQQGSTKPAREISDYLDRVGSKPAQMKVGYDENAQEKLEMEPAADDRKQPLISEEQAAATAEPADGEKTEDGPALASAREGAGGTPGRRKVRTLAPVN
jgi:hypothetical protein